MTLNFLFLPHFVILLQNIRLAVGACSHSYNNLCYDVKSKSTPYSSMWEAREACNKDGLEIATISSADVESFLVELMQNYTKDDAIKPSMAYIGLVHNNTNGLGWIDNARISYSQANPAPNGDSFSEDNRCYAMKSKMSSWGKPGDTISWEDVQCCLDVQIKHVLCYGESPSRSISQVTNFCTDGCTDFPDGVAYMGNCYWFMDYSGSLNAMASLGECQKRKAESLWIEGGDNAFITFALETKRKDLTLHLKADRGNLVCPILEVKSSKETTTTPDCCQSHPVNLIVCKKGMGNDITVDIPNDPITKNCPMPCKPSQCVNNGTCSVLNENPKTTNSYECTCPNGYNGTNCEIFWNHCMNNPCLNEGVCVNTYQDSKHNYTCQCTPDYTGYHCETVYDPVDECVSNPCVGGTCVNLVGSYRCDCDAGKSGTNCENDVVCPVLNVANANETLAFGRGYLERRGYKCLPGYLFIDLTSVKIVECQQNSTWNDSAILTGCAESCPFLPVVHNSELDKMITTVNTTITFTCIKGHVINGNITEVKFTCTNQRTWEPSSTFLSCEPRICPVLPINPHQHMDKKDHVFDTTVTFWCDKGYQLFDHTNIRTIRCKADGKWSADLPPCLSKMCPELQLKSRQSRNTSSNTYQTYAKYVCDAGYRMLDGSSYKVIFCNAEQEWSDNITDCTQNRCFPLPYVANATPSTTNADYWTRSVLTCIPGHKFKRPDGEFSKDVMVCQENGWWNPIFTSCEPIYCPEISIVGKNLTRNTDSRLYGTKVQYRCFKGFYLDLSTLENFFENRCLEMQEWIFPYIRGCHPIQCPAPPDAPSNGMRSPLSSPDHFYSEIVYYACNDGKKFANGQRAKNIICNENGQWNDTDVSCKSERCDSVTILQNSSPDKLNTDWYVVVKYYCKKGYYRTDNHPYFAIKCLVGGIWNDTFDATKDCKIKSCPPVELFSNSTVNSTTDTVYGTILQYTCQPGFKYADGEIEKHRECNEDAIWVPKNFSTCQIVYCPELPSIKNTTKDSNETFYSSQVTFDCLPGFQFPDKTKKKIVTCTENATWTELPAPCEVVFCPPLPYWSQTIFNTTDNNFLSSVEYHCSEGYAFKSFYDQPGNLTNLISTCQPSKQWQPSIETCYALDAINADIAGKAWESPQAHSLGTIACVVVGIVFAIIFFIDLRKIITDLQLMKKNINGVIKTRKKNRVKPTG